MKQLKELTGRRACLRVAGAACLAAGAVLMPHGAAAAQQWPTKPVKIVVAVGPGSSGDTLARIIAPQLQALWKQPVIVENKPGASGVIGTEYVVNANDGHTILLGTQSSILPKFTTKDLKFDPMVDLVPVYKVVNYQLVIAANAETSQKAGTLQDLVRLSKASPKGLFFGGTGPTSVFNLTMGIINKSLGINYAAVDYSNIGAMNLAVLRNDAQFLVNTPSSIKGQIDAGQLRPLAAISPERYSSLPDVPTLQQAVGYKGYVPLLWAGVFVPKSMPPAVADRIARDLLTVTANGEVKSTVESRLTASVVRSSPAEFAKELAEEVGVWKDVFTAMNYKPE